MASGGYDFQVVGDIIKEYECPICLLLIKDANELPCTHTICGTCIEKWEQDTINQNIGLLCPSCKTVYLKEKVHRSNELDRIITTSLKVKCKKSNEECKWEGTISDFEHHEEKVCLFTFGNCDFNGCDIQMKRSNMGQHKETCVHRLVCCQYCDVEFAYNGLQDHFKLCNSSPLTCPSEGCEEVMQRKEIDNHLQMDCKYEIVSCEFQSVGCNVIIKRLEEQEHIHSSTQFHMSLLLRQTANLTFTLKVTEEKLECSDNKLKDAIKRIDANEKTLEEHKKKLIEKEKKINKMENDLKIAKEVSNFGIASAVLLNSNNNKFIGKQFELLSNAKYNQNLDSRKLAIDIITKQVPVTESTERLRTLMDIVKLKYKDTKDFQNKPYTERYNELVSRMKMCKFYYVGDADLYFKVNVDNGSTVNAVYLNMVNRKDFSIKKKEHGNIFQNDNVVLQQSFNGQDVYVPIEKDWPAVNTNTFIISSERDLSVIGIREWSNYFEFGWKQKFKNNLCLLFHVQKKL